MNSKLDELIEELAKDPSLALVFSCHNKLLKRKGHGVFPLLRVYESEGHLSDFHAADRVVGKAAASLMVLIGASEVYGEIMSEDGKKMLEEHGIAIRYGKLVQFIQNQRKTGLCPFEMAVADCATPEECFAAIKEKAEAILKK